MDNIYKGSENVINIVEFLQNYRERINVLQNYEISITPEDEQSISLDLIQHDEDVRVGPAEIVKRTPRDLFSITVPKSVKRLKCVEERIANWSQMRVPEADNKYRQANYCLARSKMNNKPESLNLNLSQETPLEPYSDVLITIRLMRPMKYDPYTIANLKCDREIVVLGENLLHEFRDCISCLCDTAGPLVDISRDPSVDSKSQDKYANHTKSGFLFIGDTFYNDGRIQENLDYSKEILSWAEKQPEILPLKKAEMEETRFIDLTNIRLGFPYVYQHFGACEHVFIFSDLRVITSSDNLVRSDYPHLQLVSHTKGVICEICANYLATHLVTNSSQHLFNPVRLCGKCLNSYHYVDGKKLGEFEVHRLL